MNRRTPTKREKPQRVVRGKYAKAFEDGATVTVHGKKGDTTYRVQRNSDGKIEWRQLEKN